MKEILLNQMRLSFKLSKTHSKMMKNLKTVAKNNNRKMFLVILNKKIQRKKAYLQKKIIIHTKNDDN